NDEGRLALVETICAQRSELFIRKSPATAKPSAETGHSSIVLPYNFPSTDQSFIAGAINVGAYIIGYLVKTE
ncbi:MAG: hypothetical protein IJE66_02475, partial [Akkermansia sp.]|nr:hypothetical protein [Akkermansia sp.]